MSRTCVVATVALIALTSSACASGAGEDIRRLSPPGRTGSVFSHAVVAGGAIYVSGTLGLDPTTGRPPTDAKAEARLALEEVRRRLALAGATMDDLVSVQVFCTDPGLYEDFNAVYRTFFEKGFPARTFVGSGPLLFGSRFEINGIALAP
jgi:enamine deaminase RidA (YjgF/YER057c/UK114 family)